MIAVAILIVHACLLGVMGIVHAVRGVTYGGQLWIVAAVVPVAGPVSALMLTLAEHSKRAGVHDDLFDDPDFDVPEEDLLLGADDGRSVVPLEDAMLVNDAATRRGLMMDVLLQGGSSYSDALVEARSSDDPEVAHYASSASMEIATNYEDDLVQASVRYDHSPDDPQVVKRYLDILERYLDSGLAKGAVRRIHETRYREVLARKIQLDPDEVDFMRMAQSLLEEGLYEDADKTIAEMEQRYPDADDTWIMRLWYWYALRKPQEIQRMIAEKASGRVSDRVRSHIEFWKKVS